MFSREWIIVLKVCFFYSCFKKHILSGNLASLLFIFQGILINWNDINAVAFKTSNFFSLIVLARTECIREKEKSTPSNVYLNEAGRDLFGCLSNSQFMFRNTLIKTEHGKSSSYSHLFFSRFKGPELALETKKLSISPLDSF